MDGETTSTPNETPVTTGDANPVETPEGTEASEVAQPETPPAEAAPATTDGEDQGEATPPAEEPAPTQTDDKKTVTLSTDAFAKFKAKAAKDAEAKLLKRLGYSSVEEMEAAQNARKSRGKGKSRTRRSRDGKRKPARRPERTQENPEEDTSMSGEAAATQSPQDQPESPRKLNRLQKENERLLEEKKRANRARAHEEKKRKQVERERDALSAEHELKLAAVREGVKDVDYAIVLLRRQLQGKSKEELEEFDEGEFFKTELRKSHPYLYGTEEKPADTSTETPEEANAGGAPPAPAGSETKVKNEGGGGSQPKSAKDMSKDEYHATLKKHGLQDPASGMLT